MLRITLKRGHIGIPEKQRKVLQALGLKKIGKVVTKKDDGPTQGMLNKVAHLIAVEKVEE
jgi:large subunit ribosomal protein L30